MKEVVRVVIVVDLFRYKMVVKSSVGLMLLEGPPQPFCELRDENATRVSGKDAKHTKGELTMEGLACLMSSAVYSLVIPPPLKSTISTRKTSPTVTSATGGMSGCHRL
ncbi:unnamed protein product [Prunus brigantina]